MAESPPQDDTLGMIRCTRVEGICPVPRATKPTVAAIALDRAAQACAGRGARLTDVRRAVLSLIVENGTPLGAYALLDRLRAQKSNATPTTVYRALDFLMENGLIHKLERLNAFVACTDQGSHHHQARAVQFLICRKCGTVAEMEDPSIAQAISRAAGQTGFRPDGATIEVEGTCGRCSAQG